MSPVGLILLVILILVIIGGLPAFGYHQYGYGVSGPGLILVIILVVLLFSGRL